MTKNLLTPEGRPLRTIKSFAKRTGRITRIQLDGIKNYWGEFGLDFQPDILNFEEIYGNNHPVVLEIGFGMGTSLLQMAEENPDLNYLGIEVHTPGVGNILDKAHLLGLKNLKIMEYDAIEVLKDSIADQALQGLQIFFPDPWHKTRHHKRRLIQDEFMALTTSKISLGGFVHVATDWEHYATQILEVLTTCKSIQNQYDTYAPRPDSRPLTKFEQRGHRLNHDVWDFYFKKI